MTRCGLILFGFLLPVSAAAQSATDAHVSYETYAAGISVAKVDSVLSLGPRNYQMQLAWHTTGLAGFLFTGQQHDSVAGVWNGAAAQPTHFLGRGVWHGHQREADIDYVQGQPIVHRLVPPNDGEREEVPPPLRAYTIDSTSALAQLIRVVAETGRCDTTARTYDGRRLVEIEAHTVGEETLPPTDRSSFAGPALRCDFQGRLVAGFKLDDDRARDSRPMHGSAWLAQMLPGMPRLPVRMTFETRWFGDATMYLTGASLDDDFRIARRN